VQDAREERLADRLAGHGSLLVAYSGGVDSSYLLAVAVDVLGDKAVGATAVSPSLPAPERAAAAGLARTLGVRHVEVGTDEMERAAYRRNDRDRCFHCKTALFDVLEPLAADLGIDAIATGTIVDDLGDHRPGQRAAAERGVLTPLADAGLTKADVRALSRARGLPTADKPAAACLASRVAHGLQVTPVRLSRIERAEAWLRSRLGARVDLRVRDHGTLARVEVARDALPALVAVAAQLDAELRALGWRFVTIDAGGFRSGSMQATDEP
jgi:pyridinium-3,5-biscarboxylic acid mononucleotide sulfurtransferase